MNFRLITSFGLVAAALLLLPLSPILAGLFILSAAFRGKTFHFPDRLWSFLLLAAAVSILFSVDRGLSLPALFLLYGYFLILQTVRAAADSEQKRVFLARCLFWPATACAAFGIFQALFNLRFDGRWGPLLIRLGTEDGRANSIFFHPNILAGYLLLVLGVGFFLLEREKGIKNRWLLGGGLGLIFVCLVLTQSRSAWIGAALAIAAIGIRAGRKVFLGILAGTTAAVALFFQSIVRRLSTLFSLDFFSNANRLRAWKSALRMISERPLFGFGPGTWGKVYPAFRDPLELERLPHAHNMYLHLGAEYGLIPLFCLLVVLFDEVRNGLKKEGAWPIACVLVGFLLLNLFEFVFSEGRDSILFFAALALLPSPEKKQQGNG